MSMWSRIGNLFPGKRGPELPVAPTPDLPQDTAHISSESFPTHSSGALNREADASIKQNPSAESVVVATKEHQADSAYAAEGHAVPTSDPWLAARQRPLVYAHKLRLDREDSEGAPEQSLLEQGTDLHEGVAPVEAISPGELLYTDLPHETPAERASTNTRESLFIPPNSDHPFLEEQVESRQPAALVTASGGDLQTRTARFAMLHVVAQQWRPAIIKCRYLVVIGTPTEARKLAPVIRTLRSEYQSSDAVRVCVAGGRPERIREALAILKVSADLELTIPVNEVSIDETRAGMITAFGKLLLGIKPEWMLVQGDSMTVAMASMAAYYAHIPVAHLDGGTPLHDFRTGDESDPEVLHRRIASLFASVHFADTALSKELLVRDGVPEQYVLVTGNPGVDTMHETCTALGLHVGAASARASGVVHVLVVAEMPDTIRHGLPDLCNAIRNLARSVPGLYQFVWPVVGDAASVQTVNDLLDHVPGVLLSGPAGYEQYLRLLNGCDLVLTDVEDVQEEAPSLGKPVLLMQSSIARPEAQRNGITTLTGSDAASIQTGVRTLARKLSVRHGSITNPYGDGRASSRIVDFFEGRQVLEFGRTALPRLLRVEEPSASRLLPSPLGGPHSAALE